jgi:hypothetical protein
MTNTSIRLAACALLTSTALARPGLAQTFTDTERQAPDSNGVDVITGKVTVPLRTVTVGSGDSSLSYLNGWAGGATYDTFSVQVAGLGPDPASFITVLGQTKRFNKNPDGTWTSADGDGATFIFDSVQQAYIYTSRDGMVVTFLKSLGDTGFLAFVVARVSTIKMPSGEELTYTWLREPGTRYCDPNINCVFIPAAGRVQSVNSNLGFQLKPTYATNTWKVDGSSNNDWSRLTKVTALNNAVDYCSPVANSCTLT